MFFKSGRGCKMLAILPILLFTSIQIALLFAWVKAQAPGDGAPTCQMAPFIKTPFTSNIVPLMDSYDYVQLLSSPSLGTWNSLDVDGDGNTVSVPEV